VFGRGARSAFKPRVWRPPVVVMVGGSGRFFVFGRGARSAFKPRVWRPPVVVMVGGFGAVWLARTGEAIGRCGRVIGLSG
jgi:hypothetical protein